MKREYAQQNIDDLISLREASDISGLSTSQLRLLVSKGKIWGKKIGRNWVTTISAVHDYMERDRRPGPKHKK